MFCFWNTEMIDFNAVGIRSMPVFSLSNIFRQKRKLWKLSQKLVWDSFVSQYILPRNKSYLSTRMVILKKRNLYCLVTHDPFKDLKTCWKFNCSYITYYFYGYLTMIKKYIFQFGVELEKKGCKMKSSIPLEK